MPTNKNYSFFLGGNCADGFHSLFDELQGDPDIRKLYIIKGGPGTGKSSFMKKIARRAMSAGQECETVYCASSPDSLDAVILRDRKIAYCDGTAPHTLDPKYPAAFDIILDFSPFLNFENITKHLSFVREKNEAIKKCYRAATHFIKSASEIETQLFDAAVSGKLIEHIKKRASGIISREISHKKSSAGAVRRRLLTAITPQGVKTHFETVSALCDKVYELEDSYGLSHFMLAPIADAAVASGYDVFACHDPINPENKISHLIIPQLSLGFVSSNTVSPYDREYFRKVRLNSYVDFASYEDRKKVKSLIKTVNLFLALAGDEIKSAKKLHDELETIYSANMDFDAVNALIKTHLREIAIR